MFSKATAIAARLYYFHVLSDIQTMQTALVNSADFPYAYSFYHFHGCIWHMLTSPATLRYIFYAFPHNRFCDSGVVSFTLYRLSYRNTGNVSVPESVNHSSNPKV